MVSRLDLARAVCKRRRIAGHREQKLLSNKASTEQREVEGLSTPIAGLEGEGGQEGAGGGLG